MQSDRFDFLFVMAGRTGSMAMQNFLAMHPDIAVVPRSSLDEAIAGRGLSLSKLHEEFLPVIRHCHSVGKKAVLVLRDYLPLWHDETVIESLSQIVHPDGLVMVVRDPQQYLISWLNSHLFTHFGYVFEQNSMPWFYGGNSHIFDIPIPHRGRPVSAAYPTTRLNEIGDPKSRLGDARLGYAHYFEFYSRLSKYFPGKKILFDSSVLSSGEAIKRLFGEIGVDPGYSSPNFDITQNGRVNRYMHSNNVVARVFGGATYAMRLWTHEDIVHNLDQSGPGPGVGFVEIASIPVTSQHRSDCPLPLPFDRIALGVHRWCEVPLCKWRFLTNSGNLDRALEALFDQWIVNVNETERALRPHVLSELPPEILAEVERVFESDTRHLITLFPEELGHWQPSVSGQDSDSSCGGIRNSAVGSDGAPIELVQDRLHKDIYRFLQEEAASNAVSYNKVAPYQGYARIGLDGVRSLEERFAFLGLDRFCGENVTVLDIGSNTGFFVVEAALKCRKAHGIEPNPYLNAIGMRVATHLGVASRVELFDSTFADFVPAERYNLVLCLAAFYTADGRERTQAHEYFEKIDRMLADEAVLVYESTGYSKDDDQANPFGSESRRAQEAAFLEISARMKIMRDDEYEASNAPGAFRRVVVARRG